MSLKFPTPINAQLETASSRLADLSRKVEQTIDRTRGKLWLYLGILVVWFFGQPFAGSPVIHFVIQSLGLLLIAMATGAFRVLEEQLAAKKALRSVEARILTISGQYGVDLEQKRGDAVEIARELEKPEVLKALQDAAAAMLDELARIDGVIDRGVFGVYVEMFKVIQGRVDTSTPANVASGATQPVTAR